MREPDGRVVPAGAVIAAAENSGRIGVIDRWVLSTTLAWIAEHNDALVEYPLRLHEPVRRLAQRRALRAGHVRDPGPPRARGQPPVHGNHRERGPARPGQHAPLHRPGAQLRRQGGAGRLRRRLHLVLVPEGTAGRRAQDRRQLHRQHQRASGQRGHRRSHRQPGGQPGHEDDRRMGRRRGHRPDAGRNRRRLRAGLCRWRARCRPNACWKGARAPASSRMPPCWRCWASGTNPRRRIWPA